MNSAHSIDTSLAISGAGGINFTAFFSPSKVVSSGWIWGAGPAIIMKSQVYFEETSIRFLKPFE